MSISLLFMVQVFIVNFSGLRDRTSLFSVNCDPDAINPDQARLNPTCSATETSKNIYVFHVASLASKLSR